MKLPADKPPVSTKAKSELKAVIDPEASRHWIVQLRRPVKERKDAPVVMAQVRTEAVVGDAASAPKNSIDSRRRTSKRAFHAGRGC